MNLVGNKPRSSETNVIQFFEDRQFTGGYHRSISSIGPCQLASLAALLRTKVVVDGHLTQCQRVKHGNIE